MADTAPQTVLRDAKAPARLLGDVGGTNARFALQATDGAPITDVATLPTHEHATLTDAIQHYLAGLGRAAPPWCAIGIANPVTGDAIHMTNSPWSFSIEGVRRAIGFERFVVINDFTALAFALTELPPRDLQQLGGGAPVANTPIGLIGPGTGLGVSGLVPNSDGSGRWTPLKGEGGHATLAATNAREDAVLEVLRDRYGHVSAERAVSGQGLEALYAAVGLLDTGNAGSPLPAAEITQRALAGTDRVCAEAVDLFCSFLGNAAGNLALTLGALGGVYVGGGIVPHLGDAFMRSPFRRSFENKGRFRSYLEAIPVFVIHAEVSPALLGASRALI